MDTNEKADRWMRRALGREPAAVPDEAAQPGPTMDELIRARAGMPDDRAESPKGDNE